MAALGLPINDLFRYALLVVSTVLIVVGTVSTQLGPWLGAVAAVALCVFGQVWLAAPRIEEGHNLFIVDGAGGALEASLPPGAFRPMAAELDAKYPPARRCDPRVDGCWRGQGFPDGPFAFSADGMYQRPAYSRRVSGIDFSDPVWLHLGFINELRYNWNSKVSDLERASRDRRFWAWVHRWTLEMPWFVMYRFPSDFVGSDLCWRGNVLWEGAGERFEPITHDSMQCRTLTTEDAGRRIFGVAIKQGLAMRLQPTAPVRLRQLLEPGLALVATAAVVVLLVLGSLRAGGWRRTVLPFTLTAITLVVVFFNDASFIGGLRPFESGDDGLVYDGYARAMLRQLVAGDIAGALEGGEKVFYFTPGLRYLRVVEHLVFGETYLGYLSLILLLPFLVFVLFRRFLPLRWALAVVVIFAAIPVGALFGSSLVQYVKWAARGFADPAAYTLFLAGLVLLVGRTGAGPRDRLGLAFAAGLLFALALFVRPNIAPAAGVLLAGAGLAALWQRQYRRVAGLIIGFLPVFGMALHNWVYGGVFALFTATATHPGALVTPPAAYLSALAEVARFDLAGDHIARAIRQIGGWLAGPSEAVVMAPLHAVAIAVLVRVAVWGKVDPWLRLIAGATLLQQCVGMFYATAGRYYYLTWLLTLLVAAVWVHGEGLDLARRRFPRFSERVAKHPHEHGARARARPHVATIGAMRAERLRPLPRPRSFRRRPRQRQKPVQLCEQQCADVELGDERAGPDQANDLRRRHQLHLDPRLRLEGGDTRAGFDKKRMNAVAEPARTGAVFAQVVDGTRGQASLFEQFAPAAVGRSLPGIDQPGRQLPRECFERRAVLPHDRDLAAASERDDRDIVGLLDRVVGLRRLAARKLDLARDDAHPRRNLGGAARAYSRPFHREGPFSGTVSGGRRNQVVAKA